MSLTGFQRRRRMLAKKKLEGDTNKVETPEQDSPDAHNEQEQQPEPPTNKEAEQLDADSAELTNEVANDVTGNDNDEQTDAQNDETIDVKDHAELTAEEVDEMEEDEIRSILKAMGKTAPHNTGLPKLKERLKNELAGTEN